jgi:hypothetical protein
MIYCDVNDATSWPAVWPQRLCCKTFHGPRRSKVFNSLTSLLKSCNLVSLLPSLLNGSEISVGFLCVGSFFVHIDER